MQAYKSDRSLYLVIYSHSESHTHTLIVPVVLLPVKTSSNVVFPLPDGPMIPIMFPGLKYTEIPLRISLVTRPPNAFLFVIAAPSSDWSVWLKYVIVYTSKHYNYIIFMQLRVTLNLKRTSNSFSDSMFLLSVAIDTLVLAWLV